MIEGCTGGHGAARDLLEEFGEALFGHPTAAAGSR